VTTTDAASWLNLVDRYGLPLMALGVILVLFVWGVRAMWSFSKPLVSGIAEKVSTMVDRQIAFVDTVEQQTIKQTAAVAELVDGDQHGHRTTHDKLAAIHEDVKAIKGRG
jgi:hypothetical protein